VLPKHLVAIALIASLGLSSRAAHGQSDSDRAAAQTLFEEGQALKDAGNMREACDKFQASQKLDAAVGTQLNLADCYEQLGKTASAWVNFVEVAESKEAGEKRAAFAQKRADALRPRLTKLVIQVAAPARDMTIHRGDVLVPRETWGTSVPVDPGSYPITARAPGKSPWRETVKVEGEGEEITVRVPALLARPAGSEPEPDIDPPSEEAPRDDGSGQRIAGGVIMGLGIAGIVAGGVLAGLAHAKAGESEDHCFLLPDDPNACSQEGVDLREEAQAMQKGYIASFAVGGAAFVAGLVTLLTAPDGSEEALVVLPALSPTEASLLLRLRF
jgi:tetratricopeptide (TPR) repeat protein